MRIAVFGAGNVATHLAKALAAENEVVQIVSRTAESSARLAAEINAASRDDASGHVASCSDAGKAKELAPEAEHSAESGGCVPRCEAITDISALRGDCDIYLICVNDDAIADVVASTPDYPGIWCHTSGSVPVDVFAGKKSRYGVFYPLQTFSRDIEVELSDVAMLIEGSAPDVAATLTELACGFSNNVKSVDSEARKRLHVAAVYACNFANLMWLEADGLLHENGLDISVFRPLLRATLDKLSSMSPREAMTGPARRGDVEVIRKHLSLLPNDMKGLYATLSQMILDIYHPGKNISC